jgi:glycosyltransferase involved in cell wall biosynthesis
MTLPGTATGSSRRIRVLYPASLFPGGAERQMLLLAKHLPRDRFDISFVLLGAVTPLADEAVRAGATVHALNAPRRAGTSMPVFALKVAGRVAAYVRLCRRERYDIVDAWLYLGYGMAAVTRPFSRVPVLIAGRRSLSGHKAKFGMVDRAVDEIARRWSNAIVANSEAVAADVANHEHIDPARIRVIHNGVRIPPPSDPAARTRLRAGWGVAEGDCVVGCVGTFKAGKGQRVLVEVIAAVRSRLSGTWLVFAGDGPERAAIERRVADLGLDRVLFLGNVPDAREVYDGFDVLASASDAEGLPNAVLEAAAAARPIVATDAGGTREIVTDGLTGLLVPIGDADRLTEAIVRVLEDRPLAERLGRAAREHVAASFGLDRFVSETAAFYEELHERHGS